MLPAADRARQRHAMECAAAAPSAPAADEMRQAGANLSAPGHRSP
ncbi:hypothetical protein ACFFGG_00640 [Ottowia pentelensis]|uniref:Uncharacterized protein n=1 Tax=Ottowia pentelensis TaxID=511108 RepID=A0ABV6PMI7_9BURK